MFLSNILFKRELAFQAGITGNHKLNYANVDFEFPLEVQQYGATSSEVRTKNSIVFSF